MGLEKLLVSDNHSCVSNKYSLPNIIANVASNKNWISHPFWKKRFFRFAHPCLNSFVFTVLLIPSFHVLAVFLKFCFNLVANLWSTSDLFNSSRQHLNLHLGGASNISVLPLFALCLSVFFLKSAGQEQYPLVLNFVTVSFIQKGYSSRGPQKRKAIPIIPIDAPRWIIVIFVLFSLTRGGKFLARFKDLSNTASKSSLVHSRKSEWKI